MNQKYFLQFTWIGLGLILTLLVLLTLSACSALYAEPTITPTAFSTTTPTPHGGGLGRVLFVAYALASDPQQDSEIFLYDFATQARIPLTDNDVYDGAPVLSPDGTRILYYSDRGSGGLYEYTFTTQVTRQITEGGLGAYGHEYSPDGSLILTMAEEEGDLGVYLMTSGGENLRRLSPVGDETDYLYQPKAIDDWGAVFSVDGQRIFFLSDEQAFVQVYSMDLEGKDRFAITDERGDITLGGLNPDGVHLSFFHDRYNDFEVYLTNKLGGPSRQITDNHIDDLAPVFTPDGLHIVFSSNRDGSYNLYRTDLDGHKVEQLTANDGDNYALSFSPDGRRLLFSSNQDDGRWYLYQLDLTTLREEQLVYLGEKGEPAFYLR